MELNDFKYLNIFFENVGDNIFWNQGMNFSWKSAVKTISYDFFIWLNNDTFLYQDAIKNILKDYNSLNKDSILTGITNFKNNPTYGGRLKFNKKVLNPIGEPQKVKYMNGNFVLVPNCVFLKIGYLNRRYTHSLGDIDYGLRARSLKIGVFCSSNFVGICQKDNIVWYDESSFLKRLKKLNSPKGVPLREYFYFNNYHFGLFFGIKFLISSFVALISPKFYKLIK